MPSPAGRDAASDRGSASLHVLFAGMMISLFGLATATIGGAATAGHRARTAADLGALAGAAVVFRGEDVACARASKIITANGAALAGCRADGQDLLVSAEVTWRGWTATATARAGPLRA